jgi:hypothetical protein
MLRHGVAARPAVVGGERDVAVDRIKTGLVAVVIAAHCAITYGAGGSWFYREAVRSTGLLLREAIDGVTGR